MHVRVHVHVHVHVQASSCLDAWRALYPMEKLLTSPRTVARAACDNVWLLPGHVWVAAWAGCTTVVDDSAAGDHLGRPDTATCEEARLTNDYRLCHIRLQPLPHTVTGQPGTGELEEARWFTRVEARAMLEASLSTAGAAHAPTPATAARLRLLLTGCSQHATTSASL